MKQKETKAQETITLDMESWLGLVDELEIEEKSSYAYKKKAVLKLYLYMLVKKITKFKTMANHLKKKPEVLTLVGLDKAPHRTTLSKRFKGISESIREQLRALHSSFVKQEESLVELMSTDSSLIEAEGNLWHKKDKAKGVIPSCGNIDIEAQWGISGCKKWTFGYRLHCVVSCQSALPYDIQVEPANVKDAQVFRRDFVQYLPKETLVVLGDSGYDDATCYELCDTRNISLITPAKAKKSTPPERLERIDLYNDHDVREIFVHRKTSVEPFQGHLKALFGLEKLCMKGIDNVRALVSLATFAYLLLAKLNSCLELDILKLQDTLLAIR